MNKESLSLLGIDDPSKMEASTFLKEDTLAFWNAASFQQTIGKICDKRYNKPDYILLNDLNEKGLWLYYFIQKKIENEEWKGNIENPSFEYTRSGFWKNNTSIPGYELAKKAGLIDENSIGGSLCTYNNLCCIGFLNKEKIYTSNIILYNDDWIYTSDGVLFKLSYKK